MSRFLFEWQKTESISPDSIIKMLLKFQDVLTRSNNTKCKKLIICQPKGKFIVIDKMN